MTPLDINSLQLGIFGQVETKPAFSRPGQDQSLFVAEPRIDHLDLYLRHRFMPQRNFDGSPQIVCADDSPGNVRRIRQLYGASVSIRVQPLQHVTQAINRAFGGRLGRIAVCDLARHKPEFSAGRVTTQRQIICALIIVALCVCVFIVAGGITHFVLSGVLAICFAANAGLRALLTWKGAGEHSPMDEPMRAGPFAGGEPKWPIYTIIVPMYHEANVMSDLVMAVNALDYPGIR